MNIGHYSTAFLLLLLPLSPIGTSSWGAGNAGSGLLTKGEGEARIIAQAAGSNAVEFRGRDSRSGAFVYESGRFALHSEFSLSSRRLEELVEVCEATYALVNSLPIAIHTPPPEYRHVVRLFAGQRSYARASNAAGSYGAYNPASGEVLIPLASLDLRRPRSYWSRGQAGPLSTLAHEVAHQLLNFDCKEVPVWLDEGLASFVESLPYAAGEYVLHSGKSRRFYEMLLRKASLGDLEDAFNLGSRQWSQRVQSGKAEASRLQFSALALMVFVLDGNSDGIARYQAEIDRGSPEILARSHLFGTGASLPEKIASVYELPDRGLAE